MFIHFLRRYLIQLREDRLSELVSCLLGQKVTVLEVFPNEDSQFLGVMIIMDMVVMMADGVSPTLRFRRFHMIFRQREYRAIQLTLCCVSIRLSLERIRQESIILQ
ncbi:MAG: hypothetical protein ACLRMX_03230 [Lachnospira eligens]